MPTLLRRVRHGMWRLYRRPVLFSVAAAVLAGATFVTVHGSDTGPRTEVVVAARDVAPGTMLSAEDVRLVERPVSDVPADAVADDPDGRTALVGLVAGEVIVERRLAPGGVGPVAALLAPGAVGVSLPTSGLPDGLAVGDRLDLVIVSPGSTATISPAAPVIGLDERAVTVAVPIELAPTVVEAVVVGELVPVVAPSW